MKILITGGAGFIGSHLAEACIAAGAAVTIIDNLSTGCWTNVRNLEKEKRFRMLVASAADRRLLDREVEKHDFIYHLASAVGVKLVIDRPVATVQNIFDSTDAILQACSKYRRPVLITSTSEVYGHSQQIPFREDADVIMGASSKRRWAYACAKALDEFLALAHFYETNLPVFIVRLFNTIGPRQTDRYGMVVPSLVRQALARQPLTVYGTGTQKRCFCSVHDVVDALMRFPSHPEASGTVINLGSQEEISISGLAERVKQLTGSASNIQLIPYEQAYGPGFDDMYRRVPDLSRARQYLDWTPTHCLNEIIFEMIASEKPWSDVGKQVALAV